MRILGTRLRQRVAEGRTPLVQTATVLSGHVGGHLATVASLPFLARLYTPEQFGTYGLFMVGLSMLVIVVTGRLELAIHLQRHDRSARTLAAVAVAFVVLTVTTLGLIGVAALATSPGHDSGLTIGPGFRISDSFGSAGEAASRLFAHPIGVALLPLTLLAAGVSQIMAALTVRRQAFRLLAAARAMQLLITVTVQIGLGVLASTVVSNQAAALGVFDAAEFTGRLGVWGLPLGSLAGWAFHATWLSGAVGRATRRERRSRASRNGSGPGEASARSRFRPPWDRWRRTQARRLVARSWRTVAFSAPAAVMSVGQGQIVLLLVLASCEPAWAGFVALAQRLLLSPLAMLSGAISQVLLSRGRQFTGQADRLARSLDQTLGVLGIGLGAVAAVTIATAPWLDAWLLGPTWSGAGEVLAIMTVPVCLFAVVASVEHALEMVGRQDVQIRRGLLGLALVSGTATLGYLTGETLGPWSDRMTLVTLCAAHALAGAISLVWIRAAVTKASRDRPSPHPGADDQTTAHLQPDPPTDSPAPDNVVAVAGLVTGPAAARPGPTSCRAA